MNHGLVNLDLDSIGVTLEEILYRISAQLVSEGHIGEENSAKLRDLWMKKHRHQFEGPRKAEGNLSAVIKELLVQKLESKVLLCIILQRQVFFCSVMFLPKVYKCKFESHS